MITNLNFRTKIFKKTLCDVSPSQVSLFDRDLNALAQPGPPFPRRTGGALPSFFYTHTGLDCPACNLQVGKIVFHIKCGKLFIFANGYLLLFRLLSLQKKRLKSGISLVLLPCQLMKCQLICQKLVRKLLLSVCCFSQ